MLTLFGGAERQWGPLRAGKIRVFRL